MRKAKYSDRISVLVAICDDDQVEILQEYLTRKKLKNGLIFMGKGTAESTVADVFGFGLSDKLITALLVPESIQDKLITEITNLLRIEEDRFGLTMLLKTSSASGEVLDMVGIKEL